MENWLQITEKKIRLSICTKYLKGDVKITCPGQRAEILAMTQYLRSRVFPNAGIDQNVIDNPLDYSQALLNSQLQIIEHMRDLLRVDLRTSLGKSYRRSNQIPMLFLRYKLSTVFALELWFCTIGSRFVRACQNEVDYIWHSLATSRPLLLEAITTLRHAEPASTGLPAITRQADLGCLSTEDWLSLCDNSPDSYLKPVCDHYLGDDHENFPL